MSCEGKISEVKDNSDNKYPDQTKCTHHILG